MKIEINREACLKMAEAERAAGDPDISVGPPLPAAHKIMTPEEYAACDLKGWHAVHRDYDGFGAIAIRYNDADMCVTLSEENDALIDANKRLREGLKAAIRAAKLGLFVINKQGVMPNSSWEGGFKDDVATAEAALTQGP